MFDERNIYNNPFQKLIFNDSLVHYLINYKLDYCFNESMGADLNYHKDDYKFYLKYYYLLCEEIETLPEGKLKMNLK